MGLGHYGMSKQSRWSISRESAVWGTGGLVNVCLQKTSNDKFKVGQVPPDNNCFYIKLYNLMY